jgi:hypothetical protein
MNTDQAKTLSESALTRLMGALEQGHSDALKPYLDTAPDPTGAVKHGRRDADLSFVIVVSRAFETSRPIYTHNERFHSSLPQSAPVPSKSALPMKRDAAR